MRLWTAKERAFAEAVSAFAFANPFEQQQLAPLLSQAANLALEISAAPASLPAIKDRPELEPILSAVESLLRRVLESPGGKSWSADDLPLYQDLVLLTLYYRFRERFQQTLESAVARNESPGQLDYYDEFQDQWNQLWEAEPVQGQADYQCDHVFSCLFLIRRAYHHIHDHIWGDSPAIESLRAAIWQSIFTHDFRRFGLLLFDRMEDVTTLIAGESGTGKELVARAIGLSRYIPFDAQQKRFAETFFDAFHPVNIAALASTVVESELFGHAKGAYTDAVANRSGWFEKCKRGHTIFLDEIGELSPSVQVKLLRVVQNREFQRVGETRLRSFGGKLLVATNRDFSAELADGSFRADLYYRLCSDVIHTPTLAEQLDGSLDRLTELAERIALRQLGQTEAAAAVAADTRYFVHLKLGMTYAWPGNFRELEQCVRNIIIRKSYKPLRQGTPVAEDPAVQAIREGSSTAEQVVSLYCRSVYERLGSYAATARVVGLDQRTVKRHILDR